MKTNLQQPSWLKTENSFKLVPNSTTILHSLPLGIYNLVYDPRSGYSLEFLYESFEFPFKIYGLEDKFISHVLKTFENTTTNLGILLHGVKGTGKTVSAKILATKMQLPVILISQPYENLVEFLVSLDLECILFFDEFEKNFSDFEDSKILLSVMDGVYNSNSRKVFLLTTNSTNINENFLNRPSRIRYKKAFGNLPLEIVYEYLNENLKNKSQIDNIISYINTLANSTIDILRCIVDEINLHECTVDEIRNIMNLQTATHFYEAIYVEKEDCSTKEEFLDLLQKAELAIQNKECNSKGELIEYLEDYDYLYGADFSTSLPIRQMLPGEVVNYCDIVSGVDSNGILVLSKYGRIQYCKILNLETKPDLYNIG